MRKFLFLSLLMITFIGSGIYLTSCSDAKGAKGINVVDGTLPMDVHDITWRNNFIESLKPLTPEQRKQQIDLFAPRLNSSFMENLRGSGFNCAGEIVITYSFGSGEADSVASGDGKKYNGYFENELYAVAKGPCIKDSVTGFVKCFNGWIVMRANKENEMLGTYSPIFTVEKGRGYNYYVDYHTSIWIAEQFHINLYAGKGSNRRIITPQRARELEDSLAFIPVVPDAYTGDRIDLGNMTYTRAKKE